MKTELKAKFLQHILGKKKENEGFTLIELLVVIIIIGILSAIALPSFLNQANKAKQSEAKTYIGSLNTGEQAYYTEKGAFNSDITSLGVGVQTQTVNYIYSMTVSGTGTGSKATATSATTGVSAVIRNYAGTVALQSTGANSDITSVAILCETTNPGAAVIPSTDGLTCPSGATQVGK